MFQAFMIAVCVVLAASGVMAIFLGTRSRKIAEKKVRFEKCACGSECGLHGHLHAARKSSIRFTSLGEAEVVLNDELGLTEGEKEEVCNQLRAAGLAEKVADNDPVPLFARMNADAFLD
jgi:hypothetical protein